MLALIFCTLLLKYLMKILGRSALGKMVGNVLSGYLFESVLSIWYCSLQEDARERKERKKRKLYFNNLLHIHQHTFLKYMIQSVIEGKIRRQICLYTIFPY